MQGTDARPRPRWYWQAALFAFLTFHGLLSLRSAVLEDDRWGWRMFHHVTFYRLSYEWVMEDGSSRPYKPGKELIRAGRGHLSAGNRHRMWYATGATRSMLDAYLEWLWENKRPDGAAAIRAQMSFTINDEREPTLELHQYPEES